jgi:hypothetical protein
MSRSCHVLLCRNNNGRYPFFGRLTENECLSLSIVCKVQRLSPRVPPPYACCAPLPYPSIFDIHLSIPLVQLVGLRSQIDSKSLRNTSERLKTTQKRLRTPQNHSETSQNTSKTTQKRLRTPQNHSETPQNASHENYRIRIAYVSLCQKRSFFSFSNTYRIRIKYVFFFFFEYVSIRIRIFFFFRYVSNPYTYRIRIVSFFRYVSNPYDVFEYVSIRIGLMFFLFRYVSNTYQISIEYEYVSHTNPVSI